jgi:hypothetical protein
VTIAIEQGITIEGGIYFGGITVTEPTVIGQPYGGGYYAGKINQGGVEYYLVVAPKNGGEVVSRQWKTTASATSGTTSVIDGPSNTAAMVAAGIELHPAAQFCVNLTIGGYTDWYLPAQNELEVCYYFLKPTTTNNDTASGANPNAVAPEPINTNYAIDNPQQTSSTIFQTGSLEAFASSSYWSSTQTAASSAVRKSFTSGTQFTTTNKTNSYYVRAIRRVPV